MEEEDQELKGLLSPASRVVLPDVDEALTVGYAIHVADDPALEGRNSKKLAQRRVDHFYEIKTNPGTPARAYYECVTGIAVSLGRGLTRRKEAYLKQLEKALANRNLRLDAMRMSRKGSRGLNVLWRISRPFTYWLTGVLVAQFIGLFTSMGVMVHTAAHQQTSSTFAAGAVVLAINIAGSALLGAMFVALGKSVSAYWLSYVSSQIEKEYGTACYLADMHYEESKLLELTIYREQLRQAWRQYAGEEYPERISYQMVTEGDILARRRLEQRAGLSNLGDLRSLVRFIQRVRNIGKKRNGNNNAVVPAPISAE